MTDIKSSRVCIIGCGRWLRRDDQVGLIVARELERQALPETAVLTTESPAADIPANMAGADLLIVVDAARPAENLAPGSWRRIDYGIGRHRGRPLPGEQGRIGERGRRLDVHQLSVDAALQLAEQLGLLPPDVWVYAVAAGDCGYGEALTPQVAAAAPALARQITADVAAWEGKAGAGEGKAGALLSRSGGRA